jgi:hypothetical protein
VVVIQGASGIKLRPLLVLLNSLRAGGWLLPAKENINCGPEGGPYPRLVIENSFSVIAIMETVVL